VSPAATAGEVWIPPFHAVNVLCGRHQLLNPRTESGHRKRRHHQHLTRDIGHPALAEYLGKVIPLMRACSTWEEFERRLNKIASPYGDTIPLDSGDA